MKKAAKFIETTKPKYARLMALGTEKMDKIDELLKTGTACMAVAKIVQTEWHELEDVKLTTLTMQLQRYKDETIFSKKDLTRFEQEKIEYVRGQLDVLTSMEELARIQRERLDLVYSKEKTARMLLGTHVRGEVRELAMLYKEIQELRFQLGIDVLNQSSQQRAGVRVTTPDGSVIEAGVQTGIEQRSSRALEILGKYQVIEDP